MTAAAHETAQEAESPPALDTARVGSLCHVGRLVG
eukprot:SAG11_NODE_25510_length_358_cov_0.509653_1_plen_34_part_01